MGHLATELGCPFFTFKAMKNSVFLGEYQAVIKCGQRRPLGACAHKRVVLDDSLSSVVCQDCEEVLSPYEALRAMVLKGEAIQQGIAKERQKLKKETSKALVMLAARQVQSAWRDPLHVPSCPHCGEGISAMDGLGTQLISRKIDDKRRINRKDAAKIMERENATVKTEFSD